MGREIEVRRGRRIIDVYRLSGGGAGGSVGPQGPQGAQGEVGPAGPAGPQGPQGLTGPAGADGTNGADGATGPQGIQGLQGLQGPQGEAGPAGAQGPKGDDGAAGAQGIQGETGPQGPAGANGADGKSAHQSWVDLGNSGDEAAFIASLVGAQGAQGPQGNQGIQGIQGPQGPEGPAGSGGGSAIETPIQFVDVTANTSIIDFNNLPVADHDYFVLRAANVATTNGVRVDLQLGLAGANWTDSGDWVRTAESWTAGDNSSSYNSYAPNGVRIQCGGNLSANNRCIGFEAKIYGLGQNTKRVGVSWELDYFLGYQQATHETGIAGCISVAQAWDSLRLSSASESILPGAKFMVSGIKFK